jgi:ParB-like chromosome segregation protein Spo0J
MHTKPYVLVAGGHRTAAHIKLKRKSIPAVVIDKEKAAAWEVEENLLRSEPNALERADYIHKYASAVRAINPTGKQQGGIQPHDRSISRVARALGFSRKAVSDAFLHHALSSKVRGLLVEHGLHKKASFLTRIAKMDNQSNQICAIEDRAGLRVAVKACGKAYERGEKSAATDRSRDEPFLPSFQSLEKAWKESAVRSIYEGSPRNVRQAFVRKIS